MQGVKEFYLQEATRSLSQMPWLAALQNKALEDFTKLGFPDRHIEDWKYTRLDTWLSDVHPKDCTLNSIQVSWRGPFNPDVIFINGFATTLQANSNVVIMPLQEAIQSDFKAIRSHLCQVLNHTHGLHALNTAHIENGLFVYVPAGVKLDKPLVLGHYHDNLSHTAYYRHVVLVEPECDFTLIEMYEGQDEGEYVTNSISEVVLLDHAKFNHYKVQLEGAKAFHFGHTAVIQKASSQFESHVLSLGGKLSRSDLSVFFKGSHARASLNGIYLTQEGQHMDHHTDIHHLVADCYSEQDYKGILKGHSQAVFNGKVVVQKGAKQTEAKQHNKNLLLSKDAQVNTKPELSIFADDVRCTHGATVGQLDEEALFYFATRGIEAQTATHFLIKAFVAVNLAALNNQILENWVSTWI